MRAVMYVSPLLVCSSALAHVPYIEQRDYSESRPFVVQDAIENSKAVYAWFSSGSDLDVYTFEVGPDVRVHLEVIVPVCPGYEELRPSFALVGPSVEQVPPGLPFDVPPGYGALVVEDDGGPRETFYEPFGGKSYYQGPVFDQTVSGEGTWYVYYWDPEGVGGDYGAVLGYLEVFSPADLARSAVLTPIIRQDGELHVECP